MKSNKKDSWYQQMPWANPFTENKMEHPDPKKHQQISFLKSGIRIAGYALLLGIGGGWAISAAIVLIVSEAIGIYEELV